jgi:hypothetical protein
MSSRIISSSRITSFALTVGLAIASTALPIATNAAVAQDHSDRFQDAGTISRQDLNGLYDYAGPGGLYGARFSGPYIFVPGLGIVDEPCGLPTSACSNSERGAD